MGDQPVARPLPTHKINAQKFMSRMGFETNDPSVRAGEDGSCLRPRGYCDRKTYIRVQTNIKKATCII
jgi:hypothetical protein